MILSLFNKLKRALGCISSKIYMKIHAKPCKSMNFDEIQSKNYDFNKDLYENPCKTMNIYEIRWNSFQKL